MKTKNRPKLRLLSSAWLTLFALPLCAQVPGYEAMVSRHADFTEWLIHDSQGMEFRTESQPVEGGLEARIALSIPDIDIADARAALASPEAWCEILFLHLNVKACIHGETDTRQWVRLYMGRKFYQDVADTEMIELDFASGVSEDGVSWVKLTADEGPYNTSDYYVGLSAIGHEDGIFAELKSSQKADGTINSAMDLYFMTLARDKVGFSVVGKRWNGDPEYVGGTQGMLERNVVRYLLALRAYMQTLDIQGTDELQRRFALWFDATERYPEQLREVAREDYLRDKAREHDQQQRLQNTGP